MSLINDTVKDTILLLPILFFTYLIIEYYEHKRTNDNTNFIKLKKYGPIFGALLGVFPQCGFSIIASMLFLERKITLGTLISVFIATSDETIPILLAYPQLYSSIFVIIITKLILAILIGYLVDFIFINTTSNINIHKDNHDHSHTSITIEAINHALKIFAFLFITNLVLNFLMDSIGQNTLERFLLTNQIYQPILAAIFGFIPNCITSVVLTQLYISGSVSFASLLAGSITNAGLGLVVLIRYKAEPKILLKICSILLISATFIGIMLQIINFSL